MCFVTGFRSRESREFPKGIRAETPAKGDSSFVGGRFDMVGSDPWEGSNGVEKFWKLVLGPFSILGLPSRISF